MAGTHRRNRDRKPGRRTPSREPKPVILIVCEGQKTEPQYLEGFKRACHNPRVEIKISDRHGVPRTLVEIAKHLKAEREKAAKQYEDENIAYDSVWCVFDIDEHPNVPDARQMARDNEIEVAISNPCFELWLLLHFRGNPGAHHRDKIREMLIAFVPAYDKDVKFAMYADGYQKAAARAARMDQIAAGVGTTGHNPTTGVYKLTELIRTK